MKCDKSVTVTRDNTVTSHVPRTCDVTRRSRVSHATTTTPHHTMSFGHPCLLSGTDQIQVTVTYPAVLELDLRR